MRYKQSYNYDAWDLLGKKTSPKKKVHFRKKQMYLCPKSDRCLMDCHHKKPHAFDKWCDPDSDVNKEAHVGGVCECPKCVKELAADVTFFEEDFKIE